MTCFLFACSCGITWLCFILLICSQTASEFDPEDDLGSRLQFQPSPGVLDLITDGCLPGIAVRDGLDVVLTVLGDAPPSEDGVVAAGPRARGGGGRGVGGGRARASTLGTGGYGSVRVGRARGGR